MGKICTLIFAYRDLQGKRPGTDFSTIYCAESSVPYEPAYTSLSNSIQKWPSLNSSNHAYDFLQLGGVLLEFLVTSGVLDAGFSEVLDDHIDYTV